MEAGLSDADRRRPAAPGLPVRTLGDLFAQDPEQWGLRGDACVWSALGDRLADVPIPENEADTRALLVHAFMQVVGVDLDEPDLPEAVYREKFARGGMSSGQVHLPTWRDRLLPLLHARAHVDSYDLLRRAATSPTVRITHGEDGEPVTRARLRAAPDPIPESGDDDDLDLT